MAGKEQSGDWKKDDWDKVWQSGDIAWHQSEHDPFFDGHEGEMFGGQRKRVFVPLCGKSKDMVWLYERGHTVVGVEIVEKAIKDFFEENKIAAEVQEIDGVGKVYKSNDGKLALYVADLFSLTLDLVGHIDLIWDCGSLTAICKADNERYVTLLSSFLKEGSTWYAFTLDYDPSVWPGPPQPLSDEEIEALFGSRFTIDKVTEEKQSSIEAISQPVEASDSSMSEKIENAIKRSSYFNQRRYRFTTLQSS